MTEVAVPTSTEPPREIARTLHRAVTLLREVSASRGHGSRLTALAEASGLPQPTAHRLLADLIQEGLLERDPATRAYRLGPLVYELGLAVTPRVDIRRFCSASLDRLSAEMEDTAYLNSRSGKDALCLDRREGSFEIRALPVEVGNRRPLGIGSGALAVLSALPNSEVDTVLAENETRYRRHSMTSERIRSAVEATRSRGFAVTSGRIVARFRGVAIPIGNGIGGVPFALGVIAIEERLDPKRIEKAVAALKREEKELMSLLHLQTPMQFRGSAA